MFTQFLVRNSFDVLPVLKDAHINTNVLKIKYHSRNLVQLIGRNKKIEEKQYLYISFFIQGRNFNCRLAAPIFRLKLFLTIPMLIK